MKTVSIVKVFPGLPGTIDNPVKPCSTGTVYLIVIAVDDDPDAQADARLGDKQLAVKRGMSSHPVTSNSQGQFTIELDSQESLDTAQLTVELSETHARCKLSGPFENVSNNVYRAYAFISRYWTLRIQVKDRRPPGVHGLSPIPLKLAPLKVEWQAGKARANPVSTGGNGEPFEWKKMDLDTEYTITAEVAGAVLAGSSLTVMGAEKEQCQVLSNHSCKLTVRTAGAGVEVVFELAFEKVFIVGEGTNFRYAIPLAKKLLGNFSDKNRKKHTPRHWVFASQYDVDAPGESVETLYVYRDAQGPQGRFDATAPGHWQRLREKHGTDFEAAIFNNPHPGYGLHMCDVMGVVADELLRGKYISVHSLGHEGTLDGHTAQQFRDASDHNTEAAFQRGFLFDLGIRRDGSDKVADFSNGSWQGLGIRAVFDPLTAYEHSPENFRDAVTHYKPTRPTRGLKEHLLRNYAAQGLGILKPGGKLLLHGSDAIGEDLREAGLANANEALGFKGAGAWKDSLYFVNYESNFTDDQQHPSWFANPRFKPGEPNIQKAHVYRRIKP